MPSSAEPAVHRLVVAALFADEPGPLLREAEGHATSSRERQLVAIAAAFVEGDRDRVLLLARDHLVDHPSSVLAAWIAAEASAPTNPRKDLP